jgi:hypothetical protein
VRFTPLLALLALALAGCTEPSPEGMATATTTGMTGMATTAGTQAQTATGSPSSGPPPAGSVWLIAETGNLTLEGPFGVDGACSRVAPDGAIDGAEAAIRAVAGRTPDAAAVLFVDPAISWAYPGACGGNQLFAIRAPGGDQAQRDGATGLAVRLEGDTLRLNGQVAQAGKPLAQHIDLRWEDGGGAHHVFGEVHYVATPGWRVAAVPDAQRSEAGLTLYWGPALA